MPKSGFSFQSTWWLWLLLAAFVTVALWQMPFGNFVLYPFTILATWFHEMGHGLTAIALGGRFEKLMIFSSGSELAYHGGHLALGSFGRALVSAGGLMGPPVAGMTLLLASRSCLSKKWDRLQSHATTKARSLVQHVVQPYLDYDYAAKSS